MVLAYRVILALMYASQTIFTIVQFSYDLNFRQKVVNGCIFLSSLSGTIAHLVYAFSITWQAILIFLTIQNLFVAYTGISVAYIFSEVHYCTVFISHKALPRGMNTIYILTAVFCFITQLVAVIMIFITDERRYTSLRTGSLVLPLPTLGNYFLYCVHQIRNKITEKLTDSTLNSSSKGALHQDGESSTSMHAMNNRKNQVPTNDLKIGMKNLNDSARSIAGSNNTLANPLSPRVMLEVRPQRKYHANTN